ncbi:hypothetical protein [Bradyrhizobium ottawaense]
MAPEEDPETAGLREIAEELGAGFRRLRSGLASSR